MNDSAPAKYLVLSDVHFGTKESSINRKAVSDGVTEYLLSHGPYKEIIFTGDLLDVNLSTFTKSIEGGRGLFGFRSFLEGLDKDRSIGELAGQWIYLPGNHDYKIWDMLSTQVVCVDVLAAGERMGSVESPHEEDAWANGASFISGIFPEPARPKVTVKYPDHEVKGPSWTMLFTHGHYLDEKQTLFNRLEDKFEKAKDEKAILGARKKIFIETAQYQTVANAVSFTRTTRDLVDDLVGPGNIASRIRKLIPAVGFNLVKLLFPLEEMKGKKIYRERLRAIEAYIKYFRGYDSPPDYFIFGHTHVQHASNTRLLPTDSRIYKDRDIKVYNAGAFYERAGKPATFIEIEVGADGEVKVRPMYCDGSGAVKSGSW